MEELKFSKKHIWISDEANKAKLGITDFAQDKLGNILFLNLPDCDEELHIGSVFGDIESVKTVSDLISPVDGTVTAVNEELIDEPDEINENPYEAWFVEIEVSKIIEELMTKSEYEEYLQTL